MKEELKKIILKRQVSWFQAIRRQDLLSNKVKKQNFIKYGFVCGRHFVNGRPSKHLDSENVDWVPSLHLGYDTSAKIERKKEIGEVLKERLLNRTERLVCVTHFFFRK
jgi:hypothetical protein